MSRINKIINQLYSQIEREEQNKSLKSKKMEKTNVLLDKKTFILKETSKFILSIKTEIKHEPKQLVVVVEKSYHDKATERTTHTRIHREFIPI